MLFNIFFSNTEVIVTQIVMTLNIVASLSVSVISQRAYQFTKFTIKFQKQKDFIRVFLLLAI